MIQFGAKLAAGLGTAGWVIGFMAGIGAFLIFAGILMLLLIELAQAIDAFLRTLDEDTRRVFLRRYWYFDSVKAIARRYGFGQSKVKMMLHRTRESLRDYLAKEGIFV